MLGLILLLGQALDAVQQTETSEPNHLIYLVLHADPMVQLSLAILVILSVVIWPFPGEARIAPMAFR